MEGAASAARRAAARASVLGDGASITRVLLFDVDGTLVKSSAGSNAVHRDAFTHAIAAVHGLQGVRISEIPHDGMTDMWIVDELMKARGVPADVVSARMDDVKREMVAYCRAHAAEMGVELLPGVAALLERLAAQRHVLCGLVTGNLEEIAQLKLAASGLGGFFSCGGYGSDHFNRGELVRLALRRAGAAFSGLRLDGALVYHTGDTLHDLRAAAYAGVRGVGVASGNFPLGVLARSGDEAGPHGGAPVPPFALRADMADVDGMCALFECE